MIAPAVREAGPADLASWDERTVRCPDGDVQQSRAWGEHRRATGRRVHYLLAGDAPVLALGRPWRAIGGGRLYVPKGPVGDGASAAARADRLAAVAGWARRAGYDAILADAEVPAASGYPELLADRGFVPAPEVGPSQHRVATPIPAGATEADLLGAVDRKTRQRFGAAERKAYRVIRYDARGGDDPGAGFEAPPAERLDAEAAPAFDRFYDLLSATGERRGFSIGARGAALAWWRAALGAGHAAFLEVRSPGDDYLGAGLFYRNGSRLTYENSGDVVGLRHDFPGVIHLLLWRALQLAVREGCSELDLGGVDIAGARHEPRAGDEMFGLYEFKRAFGGRWVALSGAHERVLRPWHLRAGTALARTGRGLRRATRVLRR